jgi:hypothetical protein
MVGGGCPGSITINDQNHETTMKTYKNSHNHPEYQKPPKSDTKNTKNHQNLVEIKGHGKD